MAGLGPAIHAFDLGPKYVDARHKAGHDGLLVTVLDIRPMRQVCYPSDRRGGRSAGFFFLAGFAFSFVAARFGAPGLAAARLGAARRAGPAPPLAAALAAPRAGRRVFPFAFCTASSAIAASSAKSLGSAPFGSEAKTPSWLT